MEEKYCRDCIFYFGVYEHPHQWCRHKDNISTDYNGYIIYSKKPKELNKDKKCKMYKERTPYEKFVQIVREFIYS